MTTVTIDRKRYVLLREKEFERIIRNTGQGMPALPPANRLGRRPALPTMLALVGRKILRRRLAAGLSQQELARRSGVRAETVCRLEAGKHRPQRGTLARIDAALEKVGV